MGSYERLQQVIKLLLFSECDVRLVAVMEWADTREKGRAAWMTVASEILFEMNIGHCACLMC